MLLNKKTKLFVLLFLCCIFAALVKDTNKVHAASKKYITKSCPRSGFMSYEPYTLLRHYAQGRLQRKAHTGKHGIRMVGNRYCIALGSYYATKIGTKLDLVMSTGKVVPCILADQKANGDTVNNHRQHRSDGSVAEFIVNTSALDRRIRRSGSISAVSPFRGHIKKIRVYKK